MCGILFSLRCSESQADGEDSVERFECLCSKLRDANTARGPDAQDSLRFSMHKIAMEFFGSELRLRGHDSIVQPHRDLEGNVLCWNGEIFEGLDIAVDENDGKKLFSVLRTSNAATAFQDTLSKIEGPYAAVYYDARAQRLFFARDPLGRRSLLIHRPTPSQPYFLLTSVSIGSHPGYVLEELSTEHIFCLDVAKLGSLNDATTDFSQCLQLLPRDGQTESNFAHISAVNRTLPEDPPLLQSLEIIPPYLASTVDELISHLSNSVRLRVSSIPSIPGTEPQARVAVLFSGGIDSTMLAFLADKHVDPTEPIDLLNVAFENPRKITVQVEGNIGALPKRQKKQKLRNPLEYSTVPVSYDVPDRLTGIQEVEELRRLCPGRVWNFVEVNVPYEESQGARPTVEALMFPGRTVMDLSLAVALYFAARGVGQIRSHPGAEPTPYTSPARVLLNGLGSDELLGGYGRHRTAYKGGWQAVIDELQLELDRIPTRNLGRDDRVISSHGKETRHPFLSLSVVSFLAQLPVNMKMDPRLEQGVGDKMLLRLAAMKVGLKEASTRKKRAMQFGSHSARMIPGAGDKKGDFLIKENVATT